MKEYSRFPVSVQTTLTNGAAGAPTLHPSDCSNPTCPYRQRLVKARAIYLAQREDLAALRHRLDCYERIGVRRFHEGEAWQLLAGSDTLYQLTILRRAVAERDATIAHQAGTIHTLHTLLTQRSPEEVSDASGD